MKYEAAKCPNCGAQLQLDDSLETGFCTYCGGKLIVQDAIKRMKVEVVGQVNVTGISTTENDIMLGQQCISSQDWDPAINIFRMAIGKKADSFNAWFGYLKAITKNFTGFYYYEHEKGVYGLESVCQNCMQLADETQRHLVIFGFATK